MCLSSFYTKFIESFIYNSEFRNEVYLAKYKSYIYSQEFILSLEKYVDELQNINLNKIEKLQQLIFFISCINQSSVSLIKKSDLSLLQSLSYKLSHLHKNCSQAEDKSKFFIDQIIKRMDIDKYAFDDIYKYRDCKNEVLNSFKYDFKILECFIFHNDEQFYEEYNQFINNKYFLYSLNGLIKDMPFLLENEVFKLRLMHVLKIYDMICSDDEIIRMDKILKNI